MRTYEQALSAAQANTILAAVEDALALSGEDQVLVEEVALVFTGSTPTKELIGVLSFESARTSLGELATVGLFHHGIDALVHPSAAADDEQEEDGA